MPPNFGDLNAALQYVMDITDLHSMLYTVGLESIAMFGSFGLFAVWCYTVETSHLALQRESKVLLLGFPMSFISYNLNQ
jgi:hypothetical protein